ncbi:HTH-type transcriptional regulator ZntR [Mycobacterium talmoniae]|uniref:HTH-type transcriptional regulator ZntR n=1 Tax=Mycobacterium talmoniae TaxID=1858794 RepID=A0A2S8BE30_9MYCO|nr:HTH-type transcriptional regulator ZntR [Mycobacterium talmoniae]
MTDGTTIGELSRLTGVPVRTIRYYCDEGLLEARRSPGGHRLFDASAIESLLLVRRLRAIGLGLGAISDVLAARVTIGEAVAAERAAVEAELKVLAWRRASLAAVEHAAPDQRSARLQVLSAVPDAAIGRGVVVEFWRRLFAGAISPETFEGFVQMTAPPPPAEPNPAGVVAYAELVALAQQRAFASIMARQLWRFEPTAISDRRGLVTGVAEACDMAMPLVLAGRPPSPGPAVDRFVDAHARARREKDTPEFRRALIGNAGVDNDPRIGRYWDLVTEIAGEAATVGSAQRWLFEALRRPVAQTV